MVILQSINVPNILIFLGIAAILIFIKARLFRLSNKALAIFTLFTIFIAGMVWISEPYLPNFFSGDFQMGLSSDIARATDNVFYAVEPGATFISLLVLLMVFLVLLFSAEYLEKEQRQHTFYPLVLFMIIGVLGMLWAADLLIIYLFSELMNISAYTLVAFRRKNNTAIEAGFKYLIMSSVASVIVLSGIGVLFYTQGTTRIALISIGQDWISQIGAIFILSGFSLKSALVPLHTWLPDAHGKAPSSISALLSGVMIQSVFYTMLRTCLAIGMDPVFMGNILLILSILNIIVGNLMGIIQKNLKRMLGYSTIAQMGYIVLCFSIGLRNDSALAFQSGFFILTTHALTKGLAFLSAGTFYYYDGVEWIKDIRNIADHPFFTFIAMSAAIFSLSAIPPFPGFTGKWTALTSVFAASDPIVAWITLAILVGSLLAFGYYLPLLVNLSNRFIGTRSKTDSNTSLKESPWINISMALFLLAILMLIGFPQMILDNTFFAAKYLLELVK